MLTMCKDKINIEDKPKFDSTEYMVEATSFEKYALWKMYSNEALYKNKHNVIKWEQGSGRMYTLGELDGRPITVCFFWDKLNGHNICFYEATSQVVDHELVEEWLDKFCPKPRTDANNFHNVYHLVTK